MRCIWKTSLRALLVLALASASGVARAQEFRSSVLCPPPPAVGAFETVRQTGPAQGVTSTFTTTTLCLAGSPGCASPNVVNGVPTDVAETQDGDFPGQLDFTTRDQNGARLHRVFFPDVLLPNAQRVDITTTYSPPRTHLTPSFDLLDRWSQTGTVLSENSGGNPVTLSYESMALAARRETLSTPLGGPFETVVVERSFVQSVNGDVVTAEVNRIWYAPGLCAIRNEFTFVTQGTFAVFELVATSATYTPEPSAWVLHASALAALAAAARRRCREPSA